MYLNCLLRVVAKIVPPIPDPTQKNFSQEVATSMLQALTIRWIFVTGVRGVNIGENLWDRLYEILSERTSWPQLIEEWSKVLESVTRALGVNFYGVDLHDLPLERTTKKDILIKQKDPDRPDPPVSLNLQSESKEQYNFVQPNSTQVTHGAGDIPLNVSEPNFGRLSASDHDFQTPLSAPPYVVANDAHENRFDGNEMKMTDHHSADGTSLDDTASLDSNSLGLLSNEIDGNAHSPMSSSDNNSLTHSPTHSVMALDDSVDDYDLAPKPMDSAEVDLTPRDPDSDSASNSTVTWVTVWRRVLGCLGNINSISKPANHAKAVRALNKTIDSLIKDRANQGIPSDQSLVNQPTYVPPFLWFTPWLLSVVKMPKELNESRSMAIQSICRILLHQQDQPVEEGLAAECIAIMGNVLKDPDTKMVTVALESLCPEILYEKVPGLCAVNLSIKAVHLGACLACFEHRAIDGAQELREQAVELLLMAAKSKSLDRKAKSLNLNGLSIYIFEEKTTRLGANATKKLLNDAFNCLLYELMSENDFKLVLRVAENLHSLVYVIPTIISHSTQQLPFIVKLLLELYCNQLESLSSDSGAVELSIYLMVNLCEFCLKIPVHLITHFSDLYRPVVLMLIMEPSSRHCYVIGLLSVSKFIVLVVVLMLSLWVLAQTSFRTFDKEDSILSISTIPWVTVMFCGLGVLSESFGMLGAVLRKRLLLTIHSFFCTSCFTLLFIFGFIFGTLGRNSCGNEAGILSHQLYHTWNAAYARNDRFAEATASLAQEGLGCCGLRDYKEFENYQGIGNGSNWKLRCGSAMGYICAVPVSCCKEQSDRKKIRTTQCVIEDLTGKAKYPKKINEKGCLDIINKFMCEYALWGASIAFLMAGVEFESVLFATYSI